jgi:hypothetical protein
MYVANPHLLNRHVPQEQGNMQRQLAFPQQAPQYPRLHFPRQWNGAVYNSPLSTEQSPEAAPSLVEVLMVTAGAVGLGYLLGHALSQLMNTERQRTCSVCGRDSHDRRTCPYAGPRKRFSRSTLKSDVVSAAAFTAIRQRRTIPEAARTIPTASMCATRAMYCAGTKGILETSRSSPVLAASWVGRVSGEINLSIFEPNPSSAPQLVEGASFVVSST